MRPLRPVRAGAGYHTGRQPAVAGLVYVLAIAVAASVGATVRAARIGAGACVRVAVAPLA
jgi:hypothetical protein